ncbi:MAG: cation-translocating P-type ATPase [Roseibacillus sp.]
MKIPLSTGTPRILLRDQPWAESLVLLLTQLKTSPDDGLSTQECQTRLQKHGPNLLQEAVKRPWIQILLSQFQNLLVVLLTFAAVLSFAFQNWVEGSAICVVVLINVAIGYLTELGAVRSMESLRKFTQITTRVRRNGQVQRVPSEELVPGDLVVIEAGDVVGADLRIITASRLLVDESLFTGESFPASKDPAELPPTTLLAERKNMLYRGTSITRGTASAVVVATGLGTELGQISSLVSKTESDDTPLEKNLALLGRKLIGITLLIALCTLGVGLLSGKELYLMIETSIALAVAAIPEGLPVIATLSLARGMWRMARSNALINRLSAVETLGATTLICSDKTGTLTENKMTLTELVTPSGCYPIDSDKGKEEAIQRALQIGLLCNRSTPSPKQTIGDPVEIALLNAATINELNWESIRKEMPLVREEAFDSKEKRMATFHEDEEGYLVAVKGAPEVILPLVTQEEHLGISRPFTTTARNRWLDQNNELALAGKRVLALAYQTVSDLKADPYQNLTFLGLACFLDPPRHEIQDCLQQCQNAGIRVVMITGDQAGTAQHVSKSLGIGQKGREPICVTGSELADLLEKEDQSELITTDIFARVTPKDKLDIVQCHQEHGSVVAMTGDGVNDAPALKKADIGIAMGQRGTEVAREASDMVLKDDSFATIVMAIQEGRVIFSNIRKFVVYLMSCNLSEVLIIGLSAGFNGPLPLLPLQILFLNMVTDVFPALALGMGRGNSSMMSQTPRDIGEPLIARKEWLRITLFSLLISATVLTCFTLALFTYHLPAQEAVTIAFLILALAQLLHVFNITERGSRIFHNEITRNSWVWGALALCLLILSCALFLPLPATVLSLTIPGKVGWTLIAIGSFFPLLVGRGWAAWRNQNHQ